MEQKEFEAVVDKHERVLRNHHGVLLNHRDVMNQLINHSAISVKNQKWMFKVFVVWFIFVSLLVLFVFGIDMVRWNLLYARENILMDRVVQQDAIIADFGLRMRLMTDAVAGVENNLENVSASVGLYRELLVNGSLGNVTYRQDAYGAFCVVDEVSPGMVDLRCRGAP